MIFVFVTTIYSSLLIWPQSPKSLLIMFHNLHFNLKIWCDANIYLIIKLSSLQIHYNEYLFIIISFQYNYKNIQLTEGRYWRVIVFLLELRAVWRRLQILKLIYSECFFFAICRCIIFEPAFIYLLSSNTSASFEFASPI